ncbi:cytochrome c oxidase assembly factor Coa1 family protein [Aquimarina sp. 2201CG5-10]|uniref:cytochrome c oxidase assembly factor Coa1 family protein n=1 Tax=Aquimarina callyspongiae TaxID=3098150 RepID=UPI002AB3BDE6|nr:cytochrome c oxidase assembly factor Coa1 family protein [Aquimarina sp. 2201CG5-10]MDY8135065.1 cytochrome c oxidase assembly factor Coa1 family protein [Aquimarina sp. 2201CG5-10]
MENQTPKKSWFARNWGWAVPVGGCLTIIILFFVFLGSVIFGVSELMTGSDPYNEGLAKAQQDDYIIELLGEPIETDGIMQGELSFKNNTGKANISIPIKGPEGKAKVYVVGTKQNDEWDYSEMYVIIKETDEQIDLLGYEKNEYNNENE